MEGKFNRKKKKKIVNQWIRCSQVCRSMSSQICGDPLPDVHLENREPILYCIFVFHLIYRLKNIYCILGLHLILHRRNNIKDIVQQKMQYRNIIENRGSLE